MSLCPGGRKGAASPPSACEEPTPAACPAPGSRQTLHGVSRPDAKGRGTVPPAREQDVAWTPPWASAHPHLLPLSVRFPFYYEVKMAFVIWLLSPYTRGASLLYRKFVHPTLSRKEKVKAAWLIVGGVPHTLGGWPGAQQDPGLPMRWDVVLCVLSTAAVVSAGDRHVHRPGQGPRLRDDGALRQEGPQHGSHRRGPGGRQGTGNGAARSASLRMLRPQEENATPAWVALVVRVLGGWGGLWVQSPGLLVPAPAFGYFGVCPVGAHSHPVCLSVPPHQSQGALAGRLRSFSMQDLRSIPDETPMHYRDPLYLEEQESRRQLLGEPGREENAVVGGSSEGAMPGTVVCPPCPQPTACPRPASSTRARRRMRSSGRTRRSPRSLRPVPGTPSPSPAARACVR